MGMKRLIYEKPNRLKETVGLFLQWFLRVGCVSMQNLIMVLSKRSRLNDFACVHKGFGNFSKGVFLPEIGIVNQFFKNHLLLTHIDLGSGSLFSSSKRATPPVFMPVG